MSKQITNEELAEIVTRLLVAPDSVGELSTMDSFSGFMTEIAKTVCDYCGGEIHHPASSFEGIWYVGVHGNESLPSTSGCVWSGYDKEGSLEDGLQAPQVTQNVCSACGMHVQQIIGAPDGQEVCQTCFESGAA